MHADEPVIHQLVIAMDHARSMGALAGLESPGQLIPALHAAGADAVMTSFGVVKRWAEGFRDTVPFYMRLDGGVSLHTERWLENTAWSQLVPLETAEELGAFGSCVMYFMGAPCELRTLEIVQSVAVESLDTGMPLMVEALPCPNAGIPDPLDASMLADACRIAFEHGADIVKTYYSGSPESFRKVIEAVPVPVLVAGGPRVEGEAEVLAQVDGALQAGATGVVFGRNIWQSPDPAAMVRALDVLIHEKAGLDRAILRLRG